MADSRLRGAKRPACRLAVKMGRRGAMSATPQVVTPNSVFDELSKLKQREGNEFVFQSKNGSKIEHVSRTFERAVRALGLNNGITDRRQKVVFHSLRHTFASRLVQKRVSLYEVKELLGHSDIAMTQRYSHLADETLREAVSKLN